MFVEFEEAPRSAASEAAELADKAYAIAADLSCRVGTLSAEYGAAMVAASYGAPNALADAQQLQAAYDAAESAYRRAIEAGNEYTDRAAACGD